MPTHSQPTPADEYLLAFVQRFSKIALLITMLAHHPADKYFLAIYRFELL
jgi:hypothetical protein